MEKWTSNFEYLAQICHKTLKKLPTPHQAIIKTDGIRRVNPTISSACPVKQKAGREQEVEVREGTGSGRCCNLSQKSCRFTKSKAAQNLPHKPWFMNHLSEFRAFLFFKYRTLYFLRKTLKNIHKKTLRKIKFSYSGEVLRFIFKG